jgi:hypothetical protein
MSAPKVNVPFCPEQTINMSPTGAGEACLQTPDRVTPFVICADRQTSPRGVLYFSVEEIQMPLDQIRSRISI